MAYDNRFTSIKPVIEAVYRDSGIEEINFESALEDAAELVGLIGVPYTYIDRNTNGIDADLIQVSDHRAYLPKDLAYLIGIRKAIVNQIELNSDAYDSSIDGGLLDDIYNNSINGGYCDSEQLDFINGGSPMTSSLKTPTMTYSEEMIESSSQFHYTNSYFTEGSNCSLPFMEYPNASLVGDELVIEQGYLVGEPAMFRKTQVHTYRVNNNVVFTSFKDGYIDVAYKAYPTDSEGFLMIPDDEKFRAALKYHLIYKIDWRKWRVSPASPGLRALLNDSETRRDWYVGAARNKSHIPNVDKMESIKNMWLRQGYRPDEHKNGFSTLNISGRRIL